MYRLILLLDNKNNMVTCYLHQFKLILLNFFNKMAHNIFWFLHNNVFRTD